MSQTATWLSCCAAGTLTRTVVHFFPSSGGVSAPYPANCKLSVFGGGVEPKSVVLEGARLSQPDGLWLDDAFPHLRQGGGFFGLQVELHTAQPRVDLNASGCIVEFHSSLHLSRFWPVKMSKDGLPERRGALPLIQDPFQTTSVIVVNARSETFKPALVGTRTMRTGEVTKQVLSVPSVEAGSVVEIPVPASYFDDVPPQECGFGLMRMAGVELSSPSPEHTAVFVMYRDTTSTHPVSVCAL